MKAILCGPDENGLADALEAEGVELTHIDGVVTRPSLEDAGVVDAELVVLTDVAEATAIPLAKELNPDVRVVVYAEQSLPEFAKGQADLAVDPKLLDASVVADELV
ncbi:CTP synthetase [Haloprofundus marisrubri]|uniref:CTP synthetase n=1 Tax=Haloprofundus marisrubri TaxID=1514971 RepID=A0A0W1R6X9_9EURY|nr:hypothetical protein [Haloprofundus marisrubri]KTG09179.1 CTP synthetase [Haloprofundus marisrubri]